MQNNKKTYFLQDLVRMALTMCEAKPTIVNLIVSVTAHRVFVKGGWKLQGFSICLTNRSFRVTALCETAC